MEIIAFCTFLHHFLQFLKEKKSLSSFLSLLKIARLWGNEISPSPGAWGLSIDVMGPFISGKRRKRFILSVIDFFSQYLMLIPIKDHNATIVSQALYERVIGYFGCPRKILSDRGTEFIGRVWGELMELLGIQQVLTSPYYPQGNGIIKRSHRTVGNMVKAQLGHCDDSDWANVLPSTMLMDNEMEQKSHGYTASEIMWGKE